MKPLLEILRLSHSYGSHTVFTDFFLAMNTMKHLALVGPSGCGKSSLLRLIAGLDVPERGTISIDNMVVTKDTYVLIPPHQRGVAMVFQDLALWPNLTVLENVELGLASSSLSRQEKHDRVLETLTLCRIEDLAQRKPSQLSGGQQQRVALARAIAVRPKLLLLDEPFTGLDDTLKAQLIADVRVLAAKHRITLLAVTHDHAEAVGLGCETRKMGT